YVKNNNILVDKIVILTLILNALNLLGLNLRVEHHLFLSCCDFAKSLHLFNYQETTILKTLNFRLNLRTSYLFIPSFLKANKEPVVVVIHLQKKPRKGSGTMSTSNVVRHCYIMPMFISYTGSLSVIVNNWPRLIFLIFGYDDCLYEVDVDCCYDECVC
ncbi:hypothetical protein M8C21_013935, partial [Ambrosia artemisiifolia]